MKPKNKLNYFDVIAISKLTAKEVQNNLFAKPKPFNIPLSDVIPGNPFFMANIDTGI